MTSTELKKVLRALIQEELKVQLPAMIPLVLTEILSNNKKSPIVESKVTKIPKQYTTNPLLNNILNETANNPQIIEKPKKTKFELMDI